MGPLLVLVSPCFRENVHCKKIQHILQCFTVKLQQRTTVSVIYSELLLFFTFIFVKYCVFCSVKCKMLRYIVKNTAKYRDFFNRQIQASILPPNAVNFVFLQQTCNIFTGNCIFLHKNCKTNKIQLLVKIFTIYS